MISDQAKLIKLIATKFEAKVASIGLHDDLFIKLGINSLQALELLSQVEIEFDVTIPDSELRKINSVQNLLDIIHQ